MKDTILDFKRIDEIILKDCKKMNEADDAVLVYSYFIMPVRFAYKDVEFFQIGENSWLSLPLLDLATVGVECIEKLKTINSCTYYLPDKGWDIYFDKEPNGIKVSSWINKHSAVIDYGELVEAFYGYTNKVKQLLRETVPEITSRDYWRNWLNQKLLAVGTDSEQ